MNLSMVRPFKTLTLDNLMQTISTEEASWTTMQQSVQYRGFSKEFPLKQLLDYEFAQRLKEITNE